MPRHRLIRTDAAPSPSHQQRQRDKAQRRLAQERAFFARWMRRLRRAFHAVEKHQRAITRLERQCRLLEE